MSGKQTISPYSVPRMQAVILPALSLAQAQMSAVATRFIRVPEPVAEKHRLRKERRREYQAKWDAVNRPGSKNGKVPYKDRLFIVWDGEGPHDTGYSLLGNSEGQEICYPHLSTRDCLDLILQAGMDYPGAIHVSFGFTYDVSCMLWELSWAALNRLYKFNRTYWKGYVIEHIPRKWVVIKKDNVRVKIFDIQSFFGGSLVTALGNWKIAGLPWNEPQTASGPNARSSPTAIQNVPPLAQVLTMDEATMIRVFKKLRSEFQYKDIEQIRRYMRLELKYTKILIEEVRNAFVSAGYLPRSWHGPGAVARMAFARHGIYNVLTESPAHVRRAAQYAFIAGRFELILAGHIGRVYTADINSAYPWFCSLLPNLRRGKWRHTDKYEKAHFAVWHIRYSHTHTRYTNGRWTSSCNRGGKHRSRGYELYPLPKREKNGNVTWPPVVTGWYWSPEAALVADDSDAEFLEGWIFDEDNPHDRPFAWITDYYNQRRQWKDDGNSAEYTLKLIINSICGQLAQRVGWDRRNRRGPKSHQLEYAGWITSSCRAAVYRVARLLADDLVSIDTDGITSRRPFSFLQNSVELGGWELSEYEDSIFWQSGIYFLKEDGEWKKARTRGITKGSYSVENLFTCLKDGTSLKMMKKVFISYGMALNGQHQKLNQWIEEPHEITMGGSGKRTHYRSGCHTCAMASTRRMGNTQTTEIHTLMLPTIRNSLAFGDAKSEHSIKHPLPWVDTQKEMSVKNRIMRMVLYDRNDLDPEDEWVLDYE